MNVITESELREMWKNGRGKLPSFPFDTRFSDSAKDFIRASGIEVSFTPEKRLGQENFPTLSPSASNTWDKPGAFPVLLSGPLPICHECGQPLGEKPEHLTQIDARHFAPKTNPRIIFRGRIDSLHAFVMLTASMARRFELPDLAKQLDTLAAYCREILSAEYNLRTVAAISMMGKSEDQLHEISHWPEKHVGIPHIVPGSQDHEILHWLNLLRTQCREVEVVALQVFTTPNEESSVAGSSIIRAINRLSSAVYVLELYFQSGILSWKVKE